MKHDKNYFDKKGNYVNVENKTLTEVYKEGFFHGMWKIENERFEDGWIRTDERLPVEDGTLRGYLVTHGTGVSIYYFIDGEFKTVNRVTGYLERPKDYETIIAWMPFPEPYPEEEYWRNHEQTDIT